VTSTLRHFIKAALYCGLFVFSPRVLSTGPLPDVFGAGIFTPCWRRQPAKWVSALRNAVCWTTGATGAWLDTAFDRSERSRSAICERAFALRAFDGAAELGAFAPLALGVVAVEPVPTRAMDEPLCAVPDEPPHAASVEAASARAEAQATRRLEISILRITLLCRYLLAPLIAALAGKGPSTRLSRRDRNEPT
jgi:hypothetical protein